MSRLKRPEPTQGNTNPVKKFLHWKSNEKCFEYYDKDAQEKVKVELPLKLLFLEHYHTIKGWSDSADSGIWSNEVYRTSTDVLEVKNAKGVIAKGIYKDIKTEVRNAGGVYHRSIYCMTDKGEIINLQLKGSAVGGLKAEVSKSKEAVLGWSDFYSGDRYKGIKGVSHLLDNQFFEIKECKEGKKGAVVFSVPNYSVGDVLTKKESKMADECTAVLQKYMDEYFSEDNPEDVVVEAEEVAVESEDIDKLPF